MNGLAGGFVGAVTIWIYEAVVGRGATSVPLAGIPRNAVGLVFGKDVQDCSGGGVCPRHGHLLVFALAWGVCSPSCGRSLRWRGFEATLVALFYAVSPGS